ncbi:Palladin, partial [Orchesella cincta]
MEYVRLVFLISELVLIVRSQPTPQGYDDEVEGEMSVPRAPKIIDSSTVNLNYSGMTMNNLQCIVEGSPTPTVFWLKDGKEIQSDTDLYNITYDVTDGKAELAFAKNAYSTNN